MAVVIVRFFFLNLVRCIILTTTFFETFLVKRKKKCGAEVQPKNTFESEGPTKKQYPL